MKKFSLPICVIFFQCLTANIKAQSVEQMQQLFPDKLAVFSNINRSVDISFKKGVPYAEANEVSEMMILNDNANGIYNKDKVYHSDFNELEKVEAYTLCARWQQHKKNKSNRF